MKNMFAKTLIIVGILFAISAAIERPTAELKILDMRLERGGDPLSGMVVIYTNPVDITLPVIINGTPYDNFAIDLNKPYMKEAYTMALTAFTSGKKIRVMYYENGGSGPDIPVTGVAEICGLFICAP